MLGLADGITACLFDLDGVLTKTASVHSAAWKEMFDEVLREHAGEAGVDSGPFTEHDYLEYVDGKPRYDGVRDFLKSRGIVVPDGSATDDSSMATVIGYGDRKNALVLKIIAEQGVEPYAGSVRYLKAAQTAGMKIACVSSSANAKAVLEAAGLSHFIDVRIDGQVAKDEGIPGKPAPDMFLAAAKHLNETIDTSAVFEDAISGVSSGAAGKFRVIIGVNRGDQPDALRAAGATKVVDDLAELLDEPS